MVPNSRDVINHTFGEALPSTTTRWKGGAFDSQQLTVGQGMTVEGKIAQLRNHTIIDEAKTYHRYLAIVLDVKRGNNRTFDDTGKEIETEQSRVAVARKGYATWSETKKADPNELTLAQIAVRLGGVGQHKRVSDEEADKLHPAVPNRFEFLADRTLVTSAKLAVGEVVRCKLHGSSHFVEVVWRTDATPLTKGTSYAGEQVGDNWGDKVAKTKVKEEPAKPEPLKDAVKDEEWD
jgi:hypothetical protein